MDIRKFGVTEKGEETSLITLKNDHGMIAELTDVGASLVSLIVPDKDGNPVDVVLGYPESTDYEHNANCYGSTIGRNGNRIDGGHFSINGKEYQLPKNPFNGHNLHSQPDVFYTRKWGFSTEVGPDGNPRLYLILPNEPEVIAFQAFVCLIYASGIGAVNAGDGASPTDTNRPLRHSRTLQQTE